MLKEYLFTSARLGFRGWTNDDIAPMAAINADAEVMRYFPAIPTAEQTALFVADMQQAQAARGYCYFATDNLTTGELIGFIGLHVKTFEADFTPCTDIGWRLARKWWGMGLATEGATRCLQEAFGRYNLQQVYAIAPQVNTPSIHVMEKIGMKLHGTFQHPALAQHQWLQPCVAYMASMENV